MKQLLRWTVRIGGTMLVLVALAGFGFYLLGGARVGRTYDLDVPSITVPLDSAAVARGRHLAEAVTLCQACHGEDLSGGVIFDQPLIASIYASNLTTGRGGVGSTYSDGELARAIREGVGRDGRGLMIMHSDAYHNLGGDDLGALIAYVRSVPPVDREHPRTRGRALGKVMVALGLFDTESMPLIAAEEIDHQAYGPADGWSSEQFIVTIKTGVNPGGRALDGEVMPWKVFSRMTDDELMAIHLYLASVFRP